VEGISALLLALLLIVIGIVLILLELVIPGGIVGFIGVVSIVTGVVIAFRSSEHGWAALLFALIAGAITVFLLVKYFPLSRLGQSVMLDKSTSAEDGYVVQASGEEDLIGRVGETVTVCRPAGIAMFDNRRLDVIAEGTFIEVGKQVKVIAVDGNRVVVVPLAETEQT